MQQLQNDLNNLQQEIEHQTLELDNIENEIKRIKKRSNELNYLKNNISRNQYEFLINCKDNNLNKLEQLYNTRFGICNRAIYHDKNFLRFAIEFSKRVGEPETTNFLMTKLNTL